MELGLSTFGETPFEHVSGNAKLAHQSMQELLAEAKLADEVGLDVFAVGEHHRPDFVVSAPEVVLAAIASVTKNIRLSSSVTVLSSTDPVRTYQNFATLDLISSGRAEIMAGRGSFIESFPLFGQDLADYNSLYAEKLNLLLDINQNEKVTWKGKHRPELKNLGVYPRAYQSSIPVWVAVGGTPASAARAGRLGLPMIMAILGSFPTGFVSFVKTWRDAAKEAGHDIEKMGLAVNSQFYIAESSDQAADEFFPTYEKLMNRVGKERGWSPITRDQYEMLRTPNGPLFVGTAQEVIDKIAYQKKLFNHTRFVAQMIKGEIEHAKILNAIRIFGEKVKPAVKDL